MTVLLVTLAAQASTKYEINVAGVEVTSDNASYITGGGIRSGYGVYNASTNTLSLYSINIYRSGKQDEYGIHNRKCDNLTIVFYGTGSIACSDNALKLERSTTLNAASGSKTTFLTAARICANLKSYNYYIKGSGKFNFESTSDGYEAIKGEGTGSTKVYFQGAQVTVSADQRSALSSFTAYFQSGTDLTIENNGSNASVSNVAMDFSGGAAILKPAGAYYSNNTVYNSLGYQITGQDIYISDDYGLLINSTNFPDANFRNYMLSLYPKGYLTTYELNNLTSLNVAGKSISNMTGIEKLTALKTLNCYNNSFSTLNLNSNTALTYLDCAPNTSLTSLYIGSCTNLETLICYSTGITSLALDNLSKLKSLSCYGTKLTSLTVTNKSQLTTVDCHNCTALTTASIYSNSALTTLNVSGCTSLNNFSFNYNHALKTLNCSSLTSLEKLYCYNNNALTSLNVSGNTSLTVLNCYNNLDLTTITGLADCGSITVMDCHSCALTDLSACNSLPYLLKLYCYSNKLTSLTMTNKTRLREVYAEDNTSLTTANINGNSALVTLDISGCTALSSLNCYNNNLTTLDVSGNTALKTLNCNGNGILSSITGLANCTALTALSCSYCALTDLSACSKMNNLVSLTCSRNNLTSLTIVNKSKLTSVQADYNTRLTTATITGNSVLKTLDIYNCTALTTLNCHSNPAMTSLDVSDCTALTTLNCYNNKLSSLNVQGCTALKSLACYQNQITDAGMTTLVGSLPTRTAANPGTLYVLTTSTPSYSGYTEGNVFNASHLSAAKAKYWNSKKYNGSNWVDITFSTRGDVNGDSLVNISDATMLINYILTGNVPGINLSAADVNNDGLVNISDATKLISYVLNGTW